MVVKITINWAYIIKISPTSFWFLNGKGVDKLVVKRFASLRVGRIVGDEL